MKITLTFMASFLGLACHLGHSAIIYQESFETDGQNTRYTASTPFNDGASDHWNRTDGSDIANVSGSYSGANGTFFWAAEDTDDNGGNGNDEQTLTISGIDISLYTNVTVTASFAAGNTNGVGASAYDATDFIQLNYDLDSGGEANGVHFRYVDNGDAFNEPIGLDANFDGTADSPSLNLLDLTFTDYTFSVADGSNLDLVMRVFMDSASEEIAFDNIRVEGDLVAIPEPSSIMIVLFSGSLLVFFGRQRRRLVASQDFLPS